jgi:hypothetical protein
LKKDKAALILHAIGQVNTTKIHEHRFGGLVGTADCYFRQVLE